MRETQTITRAFLRAWAKTGKRIAARMAMIAITTSSSMRVKPKRLRQRSIATSFMPPERAPGRPSDTPLRPGLPEPPPGPLPLVQQPLDPIALFDGIARGAGQQPTLFVLLGDPTDSFLHGSE